MSKKTNKDKSSLYKNEIQNAFNSYEPDNNGFININQLNDYTKINNIKKKHPFIYDSIKSITSQKNEEKNDMISSEEYLDFFDEQLNDINSKEGLKNIFNVLADGDDKKLSWNKLPIIAKELGDNNMANNLLNLIEQGKLFNKDINFDEFCDIINGDSDDDKNIKSFNESDESEEKEKIINKNKKNKSQNKEESEDMGTITSKNEDTKNSMDNNDGEKSNKRYHRRYRDTKNKNENKDNGNNTNNNKMHTKYRKKK
jgi:Ca2+-binding EF-hand superfamily protein